ncbi:MAG: nickel-dependent lactate racemase, partial [Promethearchaeota archaeon]
PSHLIVEPLIKELREHDIKSEKITLLVATGLHRPTTQEELERILGKEIIESFKIINHIATDLAIIDYLGTTSDGVPIFINKHYMESDLKILTGYVEPHFFMGFSGGRKSLVPGIAGEKTIQANHSAKNIASPRARFGMLEGNPLHKNAVEIMNIVGVDFTVNVCINEDHEITKVVAGDDCNVIHRLLVDYQMEHVFKEIAQLHDIVVCGNGGYPLDLNLYQAVKSMAIGEMAVKEQGTIIAVNEMSEGVGHENFRQLIFSGKTPKKIHEKILNGTIKVPDQWQVQILTRILMKAEIYVVSRLGKDEIGNIGLKHASSVEKAIEDGLKKHGKDATILILPNGPQVLPLYHPS